MTRLFGTDGVRGLAGTGQFLDEKLAVALGRAAVRKLGRRILIGRDTRTSGPMLEQALADGIAFEGGSAQSAGIIPTPAIALLTREGDFDCGIVISASHNPPQYNGIKFFDFQGLKLPDEKEDRMQEIVEQVIDENVPHTSSITTLDSAEQRYVKHAVDAVRAQGVDFSGIKVALDCAYGASYKTTPAALKELGAEVICINNEADGSRINVECGSTHLEQVSRLLKETGADIGLAHDGDADRLLAVAPDGSVVDGDYIIAICARDMKKRGALKNNLVVGTVMANLGFAQAMQAQGIELERTQVGDRYVLEEMRLRGCCLGGEQSGHIIFYDYNTTGDGLMSACQLLSVMARTNLPFCELMQVMQKLPQALINVPVSDKSLYQGNVEISKAVNQAKEQLGTDGRLLVRPSGTEPLIRVMVEAPTHKQAQKVAESVADCIAREIGA